MGIVDREMNILLSSAREFFNFPGIRLELLGWVGLARKHILYVENELVYLNIVVRDHLYLSKVINFRRLSLLDDLF